MNGPKVTMAEDDMCSAFGPSLPPASATARCASGYLLENPCIPHYSRSRPTGRVS
jgi:hypothetical protein